MHSRRVIKKKCGGGIKAQAYLLLVFGWDSGTPLLFFCLLPFLFFF
jgi:hypothetical protein